MFSPRSNVPDITTKIGSKTDKIAALSVLICLRLFNKNKIGKAVQTIPILIMLNQVIKFEGTWKAPSIRENVKHPMQPPIDTKRPDSIGGISLEICLL